MSFQFFETAMAQTAGAGAPKGPSVVEMLVLPAGFFLIMYFLMIRPQKKRADEHRNILANLKSGDEVYTSAGIIGRVRSVADLFITLDVAANTSIKVLKSNVIGLTKGLEVQSDKKASTQS